MLIKDATFMLGAAQAAQFPAEPLPEITFAGRSNVGKSSLINKILNRKQLARVANKPGKTRQINFYKINDAFRFADLPGYGYAKVSHREQEQWKRLIESYFNTERGVSGVIQLVDCRHPDMESDRVLSEFLYSASIPYCLVANKVDKLKKSEKSRIPGIVKKLHGQEPVLFSAKTGEGREAIWEIIESWLER